MILFPSFENFALKNNAIRVERKLFNWCNATNMLLSLCPVPYWSHDICLHPCIHSSIHPSIHQSIKINQYSIYFVIICDLWNKCAKEKEPMGNNMVLFCFVSFNTFGSVQWLYSIKFTFEYIHSIPIHSNPFNLIDWLLWFE